MRRLLNALFAVIISLSSFSIPNCLAETTWQSIGPFGGDVQTIAIDPTNSQTLYATTGGGGFIKTTNGGASWTTPSGVTNYGGAGALIIDPTNTQTVYAGGGGGVYKTTNGGVSWTAVNSGMNYNVLSLAVDPANSQTLYAGTQGGGVFKTTNGGTSWTAVNSGITITPGPSDTRIHFLAIDPNNSQTIYAGAHDNSVSGPSGGVLYKTTNGGQTWTAATTGMTATEVMSLAIDPSNSQTVYAVAGPGLVKSTNGGASWTEFSNGITSGTVSLAIDPTNTQTLYVGTNGGVFKTTTGGATWTAANNGITGTWVNFFAIDPTNSQTVYAGMSNGIFKSINGGTSWTSTTSGVAGTNIQSLTFDPLNSQTVYVGVVGRGTFKSANGGESWTGGDNLNVMHLTFDPANSQIVYGWSLNGVFKSTDGGASWIAANNGLTETRVYSFAIDPTNSQNVYAGTVDSIVGLFKSTNGGASWTASNSGITDPGILSIAIDPTNSQMVYVGTTFSIFKSINGGDSWTTSYNMTKDVLNLYSLVIDPTNSQVVYAGAERGVFKSNDGGISWTAADNGITNTRVFTLALDPTNSQTLYAGTQGGLFKSTNGGASWIEGTGGNLSLTVQAIAIDPTNPQTIYAGTSSGGIYKTVTSASPSITSASAVAFSVGSPGSYTLTASGSPSPTFNLSGTLPSGVTFNTTTGVLSGTPAAGTAGTYNLLFTATNDLPPDATRGVTLTVLPALALSVAITTPANGSKTATLTSISGAASGTGLSKVEVQITDGIYYLQTNNTFTTTPAWLNTSSTTIWSLDTGNVSWVDGITYTVQARASDGSNFTLPVISIVKILAPSDKAGTAISFDFTPFNLKSGDTTVASGQIMRLPDDGSSLAGLKVNLIIIPPSTAADPTPSPIIIPMTTTAGGSFTSAALTQFTTPGVYITQVRFDGNSTLAACATLQQPLYVNIQSGYAIVVTGKAPDNSLLDQHTASANNIIATLKKRGFLDANITYLKSDAAGAVTKQQIQDAITIWARDKIAAVPAPFYIVMIGHGMPDGFVLDSAILTPDDMKGYLDTLEADPAVLASGILASFNRFIIIGSCYSGAFISKLSKPGRVVMTSAGGDEESLAGVNLFGISDGILYGGDYFMDTLFGFLGRGDTFTGAFNEAKNAVGARDPRTIPLGLHYDNYDTLAQHPLLDDDGDATPSYLLGSTDGMVTASLTLGEGIRVNALSSPADISTVAPAESLSTTTSSAQLWLRANSNPRVARAWAEIRRPGSQTTGGGGGQVIPTVDMIPLIYDGNRWIGNYKKFDTAGTYNIYYYTKDIQTGEISPTVTSKVYKQETGNAAPTAFNLILPADGATSAPLFSLVWQESTDTDGLTYTLLVAKDQNFTNIVYREEDIPQAATYIPKDALKDPASTTGGYYCQNGNSYCYWKVTAIDSYGATTDSNTRSFSIVSTNALPGIIKGYVRDAATGAPITGATVTAGGSQFTTLSNGGFVLILPSSTYPVTVTAYGYKTKTLANITVAPGKVFDAIISMEGSIQPPVTGDINGDGKADLVDAIIALQVVSNIKQAQKYYKEGDVNGDGLIGLPEAVYILQKAAGIR